MNNDARIGARRGFLKSACRHCLGAGALLGLPAIAEQLMPGQPLPPRFARPSSETDEGGLWSMMDREEVRVRRSPLAVHDTALNAYLADLSCRLGDGHCRDIRVHVVRMPLFNAMMAPNGMMLVWSGLLLRVENEAQLAAVLGHEMGHYLERHQVEQLRTAKDRAVLAQLVGLLGGVAGAIGQIGITASMFSFSREHETRADRLGMRLMREAGYDGRQAATVWDNLLTEMKVTGGEEEGKRNVMFATHPPTAHRRDDLLELAGTAGGKTAEAEYRKAIAPLRFGWIQDEIKRGQYEESLVLFNRLLVRDAADNEVLYARGEVHRLRDEGGDNALALDDLQRASRTAKPPAETFRSLGMVHRTRGDARAAADAFEKYLSLAPAAPDSGMVRSYLAELRP